MRHRVVTGRSGGPRAALAGALAALLTLTAIPAAVAAQEPPPGDPPPPVVEPPGETGDGGSGDGAPGGSGDLGEQDRALVADARSTGDDVTLLVAAEDGRVDTAAAGLRALGAEVEVVDDQIGYLKATLSPDDALAAAKARGVEAVDVSGPIELDDPVPAGSQNPTPQPAPGPDTPAVNPYLPSGDIGAPQFVAANPTFDGRGTVVAIIDSGVDLDSEALAATTVDGQPKIIDWRNTNSATSLADGTWVQTAGRHNGVFDYAGQPHIAPATGGPYAIGRLNSQHVDLGAGELRADLDRDGQTGDLIGVLQDRTTLEVYVDTDRDLDFTDETPMLDFVDGNRDVGYLGTDDPATDVHERLAFTVGTHESNQDPDSSDASWVNIGIAGSRHGTHVAGIAAGHGLFGGAIDGVAPGAQIISIKACLTTSSCTAEGIVDGVVYAAQQGADVANMSIGGPTALNDGNNARAELIDRTIAEYDMQLVVSSGNDGPGANSVGDPSVATSTLSVGASITDASWRANYGSDSDRALAMMPFSSRGPREDGGFKPDVVAPGSAISTIPAWQAGTPVAGTYGLPSGYGMLNGTSMAAPQVAGAAALLISAYKAENDGARPDPAALRDAIRGSATPIPGVAAHEQGMGLVDVAGAWERLRAGHAPHGITAEVPSGSPLAGFLAEPGVGPGIHERTDMVAGGPDRTRTYTITRTSGRAGTVVVPVTWRGDEAGTFTAPTHVALPLGTPVSVPVRISSAVAGVHSGVMVLDDPATPGIDLATMNTAFVATPFDQGVATFSGTVPRNGTRHHLVSVPAGTGNLAITLTGGGAPGAGQIRFLRYHPYGTTTDDTGSTTCYMPDAGGFCPSGGSGSRAVVRPTGGIWEIVVEARRTSDVADAPYTLSASIGGATITPRRDQAGPVTAPTTVDRSYTVTNGALPVRAHLQGNPLASTRSTRPAIADLASQQWQIPVTAGATRLDARIGSPSDPNADLDLYLFNCSTGSCVQAGSSATGGAEERITVDNPAAGVWIALIDAYSVPAGTTDFDYVDSITNPSLGFVGVSDSPADRAPGASWTASATAHVFADPAAGRHLTSTLEAVTDTGLVLATASLELLAPGTATTTTVATSPSPSVAGAAVTVTGTVSDPAASGTMTFYADGNSIGSTGVARGSASIITSSLPAGTHEITARYESVGAFRDSEAAPIQHVVSAAPTPVLPVADAGADQDVDAGAHVTLDARGSSHPGNQAITYGWIQESGPTVALRGAGTAEPNFTAPDTADTLTFRVVVSTAAGQYATDTVEVDVNQAPIADAGEDARANPGEAVTLDGTGSSDPEGEGLTFAWTQTGGPDVALTDEDTATPSFTAPETGAVTFSLTVGDGTLTDTDTVTIAVNGAPVASAGADRTVNPGTAVSLDGTGSTDPDDDALAYAWVRTSGPEVILTGADTATPSFTAPASGAVTLSLTVTDGDGLTGTDEVVVTVNAAPVADAGPDQVVAAGATVTLDATGSTDPGDVLTYTWKQQSGPTVTLSSVSTASPTFTAPAEAATLVFSVTTVDPLGLIDTDVVSVRVAAGLSVSAALVGEPNPDTDLALQATVTGESEGLTYQWVQTGGPAVSLAGVDTATATFRSPSGTESLTFAVTVTDGAGQSDSDTVSFALNRPPTADAGEDRTVNPDAAVSVAGTASADPDDDALTFAWAQVDGPTVALTGADTDTVGFTAPDGPASVVLELTATDEHGLVDTDQVTIVINGAPVAHIGPFDGVLPDAPVTLDGSGSSDPDDDDLTYVWVQDSGPEVTLEGADGPIATFTGPPGPAELVFTLTVTDEHGASSTDSITLPVLGPPTADAGDDRTVNPGDEVALDGSGTADADPITYAWTQDGGVEVTLVGPQDRQPTFVAPAGPDVLTFSLTVTDDIGRTATDQVVITVNGLPAAVAGPARTVDEATTVTLDGTGSTDPDDDPLTFAWTQDAGPTVALTGAATAAPSFTAPDGPASLVFILTVTDPHGGRDVSTVTITVVPPLSASEQWVVELYSTFLHRVPDTSGLAYWAGRLDAGTPKATIVRSIAMSTEATRGPVVTDLYGRLLDRSADTQERTYWAGRLDSGTRHHWVERTLLASPERYTASGGTDQAYISDLYQRVLHRTGADTEIAYWVDRLASGDPRLRAVDALLNTPEARHTRVAEIAEETLGRPATPTELTDLQAAHRTTRDPRTVAMAAFLLR